MKSFWNELKGPFFALAPMEDVTDTAFREVVMSVSDPQYLKVIFTEFTSIDGLLDHRGFERVSERLIVSDSEKRLIAEKGVKLVAQIWGNDPDKFQKTAVLLSKMNLFDGIDINMGCPVKKVVKKKTCSALINHPALAREIIVATKEGTDLPVSVKTRMGFNNIVTIPWMEQLMEEKPAAITLHGRIQKQQSDGEANWDEIQKAVELRNNTDKDIVMLGNGDVFSFESGIDKYNEYSVDGLMVGRGVFHNPWIFNENKSDVSVLEKINLLLNHIKLFNSIWNGKKNFFIMKRFFKIYINSFDGAGALRNTLMQVDNLDQAVIILKDYLKENNP